MADAAQPTVLDLDGLRALVGDLRARGYQALPARAPRSP